MGHGAWGNGKKAGCTSRVQELLYYVSTINVLLKLERYKHPDKFTNQYIANKNKN
jgi:hypothetical protein